LYRDTRSQHIGRKVEIEVDMVDDVEADMVVDIV